MAAARNGGEAREFLDQPGRYPAIAMKALMTRFAGPVIGLALLVTAWWTLHQALTEYRAGLQNRSLALLWNRFGALVFGVVKHFTISGSCISTRINSIRSGKPATWRRQAAWCCHGC